MKANVLAFIYIALGGLLTTLVACDTVLSPPSSSTTLNGPGAQLNNRVFDGRDSLITGGGGPIATKDNFDIVTQFVAIEEDTGLVEIIDPDNLASSTLLYESRAGNPILTPDGDQITWGVFRGMKGAIIANCTRRGTHTTVHLSGLIPNGVYSVWNVLDRVGPVAGYTELDNKSGPNGPTSFRASAHGEGHISGLTLPGGEIGGCTLDDVEAGDYAWRVVAIYHIDGTPDLDEEGTFVEQGGFTFGEPPIVIE